MACTKYWQRLFESLVYPTYPGIVIVQARAYGVSRIVDLPTGPLRVPAVERDTGDPVKQIKALLRDRYDPDAPSDHQVLMFHPAGGLSYAALPYP